MKKLISLFFAFVLCFSLFSCTEELPEGEIDMEKVASEIDSMSVSDFEASEDETDYVLIRVTDYGDIIVKLCPNVAPISVDNFKSIVSASLYNGSTFHRVYPSFMIQGGIIPTSNGSWTTAIKGEFSNNGVTNQLSHIRGVISMARSTAMNSATSQFFIVHKDYPSLNGNYAGFGYVVAGMDVVDLITTCDRVIGMDSKVPTSPVTPVVIESISFVTPKK